MELRILIISLNREIIVDYPSKPKVITRNFKNSRRWKRKEEDRSQKERSERFQR